MALLTRRKTVSFSIASDHRVVIIYYGTRECFTGSGLGSIMETDYLREYIKYTDSLNYAKAADELFVSQPALRSHIKTLEDEIGSPLVIKREGILELSLEGKVLLKRARSIVRIVDETLERCADLARNSTSLFVSSLGHPAFEELLTSARESMRAKHPDITIDLRLRYSTHANLAAILDRKVDITLYPRIRDITEKEPPTNPGFPPQVRVLYIGSEECKFWMTNENPLFDKPEISAYDLEGMSLLLGNTDNMLSAGEKFVRRFAEEGVAIEADYQPFSSYNDYVLSSPHNGFGMFLEALHPASALRKDFRMFTVKEFSVPCDLLMIYEEGVLNELAGLYLEEVEAIARKNVAPRSASLARS